MLSVHDDDLFLFQRECMTRRDRSTKVKPLMMSECLETILAPTLCN